MLNNAENEVCSRREITIQEYYEAINYKEEINDRLV